MRESIRAFCREITSKLRPFHPRTIDTCVDVFEKNIASLCLELLTMVSEKIGTIIRMESCLDEFHDNVCWGE